MGKSLRLAIVLAGASVFWLGMLALLTLPCDSSVGAVTFAFDGFKENSLYLVSNSNWIFNTTTGCFQINPAEFVLDSIASGRLLYPGAVQMIDPGSTAVKSFSTSFIYQLQIGSNLSHIGPGMAFIIVPDNITLGAPGDFMGLITSETAKNYESDNHTLGVELDTYMNPGFNDSNNNHIGINLASMNSTYSFQPVYILASSSTILYQQIWIDYFEVGSRMDIYYANYKEGKPGQPQGSQSGLDLSLLKEKMFTGISSANKLGSFDFSCVCAWSFSNDGIPAPSIVLAQDATPGPPPPPAPVAPPPPLSPPQVPPLPSPSPISPAPNGSATPPSASPPPFTSSPPQVPPSPSPSPTSPSPNGSAPPPSASPPPFASSPPPFNPPPSSPLIPPSQGPGYKPLPIIVPAAVVGSLAGLVVLICLFSLCWYKVWRRPLRIFISHTGGPSGAGKNFPSWLHQAMMSRRWSRSKFHVKPFLDVENCPKGLSFARKILKELARFDVGVVVVTSNFFERHWPMTELIKFVEVQKKDREGRIRVLPLFYELTRDELKEGLDEGTWEQYWVEPSEDNHPLQLQECRDAVSWLYKQTGIRYVSHHRDYDKAYIDTILAEVDKILCDERSIAADLRWALKKLNMY